jgi:hypothetical protein
MGGSMNFKLTDKGPRLDEKRVAAFEARRGVPLPAEYRRFLLRTNGGTPDPEVGFAFTEGGRPSDSVLNQFYILKANADDPNLDEAIETFVDAGRMPSHLLPFADDQFGNQLCLSLGASDYGAVYFWNHEREPEAGDGPPSFDNLSLVAGGFDAFLELLTVVE